MLTTNSFNALLKTLEEPPAHVKFLLATTDPHKLPVTVLSRCLQFNLKNMTADLIVEHLRDILAKESVEVDDAALWSLGRAANGSMRDALSLTDQAIAYGQGSVSGPEVAAMLGTIDTEKTLELVERLQTQDAAAVIQMVSDLDQYSPDYDHLLSEILSVLHQITLQHLVPGAPMPPHFNAERLQALSRQWVTEDVQLYYQIGMQCRESLAWAPDPRQGFEMALLRMLAFTPQYARKHRNAVTPVTSKPIAAIQPGSPSIADGKGAGEFTPTADDSNSIEARQFNDLDSSLVSAGQAEGQNDVAIVNPIADSVVTSDMPSQEVTDSTAQAQHDAPPWNTSEPIEDKIQTPQPMQSAAALDVQQEMPSVAAPTEALVAVSDADAPGLDAAGEGADDSVKGDLVAKAGGPEDEVQMSANDSHLAFESTDPGDLSLALVSAEETHSSEDKEQVELTQFESSQAEYGAEATTPSDRSDVASQPKNVSPDVTLEPSSALAQRWYDLLEASGISGLAMTLLRHAWPKSWEQDRLQLQIPPRYQTTFMEDTRRQIEQSLAQALQRPIHVGVEFEQPQGQSYDLHLEALREAKLAQAKLAFHNDALVQRMIEIFGATILDDTIEPIEELKS